MVEIEVRGRLGYPGIAVEVVHQDDPSALSAQFRQHIGDRAAGPAVAAIHDPPSTVRAQGRSLQYARQRPQQGVGSSLLLPARTSDEPLADDAGGSRGDPEACLQEARGKT
ncbi:MAG: hypothetical protein AMXMBFR66_26000 [Pseudomonadota bacterium]